MWPRFVDLGEQAELIAKVPANIAMRTSDFRICLLSGSIMHFALERIILYQSCCTLTVVRSETCL